MSAKTPRRGGRRRVDDIANERLRDALEQLGQLFCLTDADDVIVVVSGEWREKNAALGAQALPGARYEDFLRALVANAMITDAVGHEQAWIDQRLAHRRNPGPPFEVRRNDGHTLLMREQRMKDGGILTLAVDITERVLAEREADTLSRQFGALLAQMPMVCIVRDTQLRCTYWNPAAERTFGYRLSEVIGRPLSETILPADAAAPVTALMRRTLRAKGSTHGENLNRAKDGRLLLCEWTNAPLRDEQGRAIGIISMGQDVTERRREQRELRDAKENLERRVADRTAALETTLRELEAFSYSVSHDLRAPLRAIAGFTRMAIEDEGERLSGEGRRQLSVVEANAKRMGDLVDALLSLSRINRATLKRERVNMRALAEAVCAELQPLYPATDLDVGDLPPGTGDGTLLRQVLANLVGNALKYSARAEMPRIEVGWSDRLEAWTVRDNGVGFDMAYAGKLFGTFERLHSEKEFEGTGIGLAIVKRVVERHGGKVGAEGAPGLGATFWFSLPEG